jgi:hypothetical protein
LYHGYHAPRAAGIAPCGLFPEVFEFHPSGIRRSLSPFGLERERVAELH